MSWKVSSAVTRHSSPSSSWVMWSQYSLNNWTAERKVRIISKSLGADTEHWANVRWGTNTPWVIPTIKDGEALISYSCCCHSLQNTHTRSCGGAGHTEHCAALLCHHGIWAGRDAEHSTLCHGGLTTAMVRIDEPYRPRMGLPVGRPESMPLIHMPWPPSCWADWLCPILTSGRHSPPPPPPCLLLLGPK